MRIHSTAATPALFVALTLGATNGFAQAQNQTDQTPAAPAAGGIEEVTVSARYREENLQQTPLAISAITAADIEQRGFTNSTDIAYAVPNASFRQAQAAFGNTETAYIRGVGQNDFNFAFEPGVAIYVDDVYYPTTMSSQFDLMDLERVEVLRGPQGTLFGRGAIGGAVSYVSKQPKGDNSGFTNVTVGQFSRVDIRAGYDFALIPDTVFVRVTAMSKKEDGYQKMVDFVCEFPTLSGTLPAQTHNRLGGCQDGTLGGTDVQGARAQIRWVAGENVDVGLSADYQRDNSESRADSLVGIGPFIPPVAAWNQFIFNGTLPGATPGAPAVRPNPSFFGYGVHFDTRFIPTSPYTTYETFSDPYSGLTLPKEENLDQKGVAATISWKINDLISSKTILAWRNWNSLFGTDQDGSPIEFAGADGIQHFTYRTFEERISGSLLDKKLDWVAGVFLYDGNSTSAQEVPLPSLGNGTYYSNPTGTTGTLPNALLVNGKDTGHYENKSGFIHGQYAFTDQLHLELGVRYSSDKKHDLNDNTIVVLPVESDQNHVDWRAGLDYQISPEMMVYTSASTGYRPPAFNPRPFQTSQFVAVAGESLTSFEVGEKADLFDRKLRVNLAAFYSDYKQRIIPAAGVQCVTHPDGSCVGGPGAPAVVPLTAYVNAPAKISGAEAELEFSPVDALLLTLSGGYTHYSATATVFQGAPFTGLSPNGEAAYVPKFNAAFTAQYTVNLPNGGTVSPRWDSYVQTEICSGQFKTSCTGGYTLSNLRLEYASSGREWTIAAGLENVTGKVYYYNIFDLTPFGEPTIEGQVAPPRTWSLQLSRKFGAK